METEARDRPKSAREVAAAVKGKASATSSSKDNERQLRDSLASLTHPSHISGDSHAPNRVNTSASVTNASGRTSPTIPTGPRSARALPTGPRADQQESPRWPARDAQSKQPTTATGLPTGPSADRSRARDGAPSSRPSDRVSGGIPPGSKHGRGDAGWPTREPVGPPSDLLRASTSGFKGRDLPPPSSARKYDREYDEERSYPRNDRTHQERDVGPGHREAPPPREPRGPPRDARDEGWPRRSVQDAYHLESRVSYLPFSRFLSD